MDFSLSDEQELLRDTVRGFVDRECAPRRVREIFDGDGDGRTRLWEGLADMGLAGLAVSEDFGGAGLELLECALVAERLGHGAVPVPFVEHTLAGLAITLGGSESQKRDWLPRLAVGEALGTVAIAEASGDWEPERWATRLDAGAVTGAKRLVPSGPAADVAIVATAGGGLALLDSGARGVEWHPVDTLDRGRPLFALELEDAPAASLAADVWPRLRDAALVLLAADAFGAGHRMVRMSCEHAMAREQFGRTIASFQAVKHQLADMALDVDPARGLFWYAAHAFDHLPDESPRAAGLAKAHITDRAMDVARRAIEIHGGIGMTWECDAHLWFKRILFDRQWLGTPDTHRARLADLGSW